MGSCPTQDIHEETTGTLAPCWRLLCLPKPHPTPWLISSGHGGAKSTGERRLWRDRSRCQLLCVRQQARKTGVLTHKEEIPPSKPLFPSLCCPCLSFSFLKRMTYTSRIMTERQQFKFLKGGHELPPFPGPVACPQSSWFSHLAGGWRGIKKDTGDVHPQCETRLVRFLSLSSEKPTALSRRVTTRMQRSFCSRPGACLPAASGKEARCSQHLYFPCCGEFGSFPQLKTE